MKNVALALAVLFYAYCPSEAQSLLPLYQNTTTDQLVDSGGNLVTPLAIGAVSNLTITANNTASFAVNGTMTAQGPYESLFVNNGNSTQHAGANGYGSVLAIQNCDSTTGSSVISFYNYQGYSGGAVGLGGDGLIYNPLFKGRVYLDASLYLDPSQPGGVAATGNLTPRGIVIAQDFIQDTMYYEIPKLLIDEDGQIFSYGTGGTPLFSLYVPDQITGNGEGTPDITMVLNGNTSGDSEFVSYEATIDSDRYGPSVVLGIGNATMHATQDGFPANGTYLVTNEVPGHAAAGGMAFMCINGTAEFNWNIGGYTSANEVMRLGPSGLSLESAGATLNVASGTNAKAGNFTLSSGNATISNTAVDANSVIMVTVQTVSGTRAGNPDIVPTAGTGFTATGGPADNSTYNYVILEVTP